MIDSHCHLADAVFAADLEAVVGRARQSGVTRALCILAAGDTEEAAQARRLRLLWPDVRFAVGVHPHQAGAFTGREVEAAALVRRELQDQSGARAVGEIGLDYHYGFAPRDVQQAVFREQVRLAADLALPVVVHSREAERDALQVLLEEGGGGVSGVFHCFTGTVEVAEEIVRAGLCVSFAGIVTFPRADALREVVRAVPPDRFLTETDAPFLAPVPFRGRRNEPAWVERVLERVAEVRGDHRETVAAAVGATFARLFGAA